MITWIYSLCFLGFCIIDQIIGSMTGRVQFVAINCIGLLAAVIIFTTFRWRDFIKLPYLLWAIFSVVGGIIAIRWGESNYPYRGQWISAVCNVIVYGFIVIRLIYKLFVEKRIPKVEKSMALLWGVIFLGMFLSRYDRKWLILFLVSFGCMLLADFSGERLEKLINGMLNGCILGFFVLQGAAFLFRPYDIIRYRGIYANENMNALFYLFCYVAFLGKSVMLKQRGKRKSAIAVTLVSSVLFAFCFMTISRTVWIAMAVVTLAYLLMTKTMLPKGFWRFWGRGIAIALSAVISFPLVFYTVRYVPAIVNQPVYFEGEYSTERIILEDGIDSEKYVEMDEFLDEAIGRVKMLGNKTVAMAVDIVFPGIKAYAASIDDKSPIYEDDAVMFQPVNLRKTIHQYYLNQVNWTGHTFSETGVQVTPNYYAPHAHNVFIQFLFDFGWIVGGLGFLFIGFLIWKLIKLYRSGRIAEASVFALPLIAFFTFGMWEIDWRPGHLSLTMFMMVTVFLMQRYDYEKQE